MSAATKGQHTPGPFDELRGDYAAALVRESRLKAQNEKLAAALTTVLDQVDYTVHACRLTDMVGACLPAEIIDRARAALAAVRGESPNG